MSERPQGTTHIVLVPGFFGFDALGQIEYYAGITEIFGRWRAPGETSPKAPKPVMLHYFDNYPTASVVVRAARLQAFLAKRIERGVIGEHDSLTLVGHSTGGLDIRRMLFDLAEAAKQGRPTPIAVTGTKRGEGGSTPSRSAESETLPTTASDKAGVRPRAKRDLGADILSLTTRVVFLSVPHFGTSLADYASKAPSAFQALCTVARILVHSNDGVALDAFKRRLSERNPFSSDLILAFLDALSESDEHPSTDTPTGRTSEQACAVERENRATFALWLEHMSRDSHAIEDLRSMCEEDATSPARFNESARKREMAHWRDSQLETLSIFTQSPTPPKGPPRPWRDLVREVISPNELWSLARWLGRQTPAVLKSLPKGAGHTLANLLPTLGLLATMARKERSGVRQAKRAFEESTTAGSDTIYRFFHGLCASEKLRAMDLIKKASFVPPSALKRFEELGLDETASDGIVNTVSMAYPYDTEAPHAHTWELLASCDHGDLIGHYQRVPLEPRMPEGRFYRAYDIFASRSKFDEAQLESAWKRIFEFCFQGSPQKLAEVA